MHGHVKVNSMVVLLACRLKRCVYYTASTMTQDKNSKNTQNQNTKQTIIIP